MPIEVRFRDHEGAKIYLEGVDRYGCDAFDNGAIGA